jgi:hypothetical protein
MQHQLIIWLHCIMVGCAALLHGLLAFCSKVWGLHVGCWWWHCRFTLLGHYWKLASPQYLWLAFVASVGALRMVFPSVQTHEAQQACCGCSCSESNQHTLHCSAEKCPTWFWCVPSLVGALSTATAASPLWHLPLLQG